MTKKKKKKSLDPKLQAWVLARQRHHLSHAHVQMARELGMNPAKLGKLDNHDQESWKAPLPEFIESLYEKSFGRSRPGRVLSIEDLSREHARKQQARREAKAQRRAARDAQPVAPPRDELDPKDLGQGNRLANLEHGAVVVNRHREAAEEVQTNESVNAPGLLKA